MEPPDDSLSHPAAAPVVLSLPLAPTLEGSFELSSKELLRLRTPVMPLSKARALFSADKDKHGLTQ